MEAAGWQVARLVWRQLGNSPGAITVLAGSGNNGGDGVVAARWLATWGCGVRVGVLAAPGSWRLAALAEPLVALGVPVVVSAAASDLLSSTEPPELVVDALLGTGARGALRPNVTELTNWANQQGIVVAVDLPTGVDADTGTVAPGAIRATATCTLGAMKAGLWQPRAQGQAGELWVADIGIPPLAWEAAGSDVPKQIRGGELLPVPAITD